jgi:hypothetical protein
VCSARNPQHTSRLIEPVGLYPLTQFTAGNNFSSEIKKWLRPRCLCCCSCPPLRRRFRYLVSAAVATCPSPSPWHRRPPPTAPSKSWLVPTASSPLCFRSPFGLPPPATAASAHRSNVGTLSVEASSNAQTYIIVMCSSAAAASPRTT